jgi:hypothetical protein
MHQRDVVYHFTIAESIFFLISDKTYKKTAIMKFWKHTHLPIECNVKVYYPRFRRLTPFRLFIIQELLI